MDYKQIFSTRANRYARAMSLFPSVREQEFREFCLLLSLQAGETFLDAPSGDSSLFDVIEQDVKYHGIDPSPCFVLAGREKGLSVCPDRLDDSPFPDACFDVIGSLTGLHHERERGTIFQEWYRILRPGGRLVVMDVGAGSDVAKFLDGFVGAWNSQGHEGSYLGCQDLELFREAGYRQIVRREHRYAWSADSMEAMAAFMKDLFGLDLDPPNETVADALQAIGARVSGHGVEVPWSLISISAIK